jgi:hypothetical protein
MRLAISIEYWRRNVRIKGLAEDAIILASYSHSAEPSPADLAWPYGSSIGCCSSTRFPLADPTLTLLGKQPLIVAVVDTPNP